MSEKKKILIIGPGMEIGGVERSLLGLLDSIDYNKNAVDLFLYSHTGELMQYIKDNVNLLSENRLYALMNEPIADLFRSGHFFVGSVRLFSKLYGDIRAKHTHATTINTMLCRKILTNHVKSLEKEYDVVYSFFQPHYFAEKKVKAKVKIGWVHTDYSNENEKQDIQFCFSMWDAMDKIACVSKDVKEAFDRIYPKLSNKTIVVENILPDKLIKKQSQEFSVENEMLNDGSFRVLSVGRFCTAKNFDIVPEVCFRMTALGYDLKWYLIGYGPDEELIRKIISEFHMEKHVIILGKKPNPYPYMKGCNLYVQPSRYEGKSVTVREAQILHAPVMITRFSTSGSQVNEGVDGFICELSIDGIVDGLIRMINDTQLREALVRRTYENDYGNAGEIEKILSFEE